MKKYVCAVTKCPELDYDNSSRCTIDDLDEFNERYPDGCPVGNYPCWIELKEKVTE